MNKKSGYAAFERGAVLSVFVGIFVAFIWLCVFVTWHLKRSGKSNAALMRDFIEEERDANNARKKEIDPDLFFTADVDFLNSLPEDGAANEKETVCKLTERTMIRFSGRVRNVDLKKAYGPSQLETLAQYEENFNRYIAALIKWAEALIKNGLNGDALRILEHTISLGSEYRKSYTLTADLYAGETDKLHALLQTAEDRAFTDEGVKRRIISHINQAITIRNEDDEV